MALGDGIRRNIAHVEPSERDMLRDAILALHTRYYPGLRSETPPGGVSWWFKQDEIHQATHVHHGPEFLPWHRELTNRFEELLRQINPQLSLHYWDFKEDPRNIPDGNVGGGVTGLVNLFDANFIGFSSGSAGDPLLLHGFYDPFAGTSGHPPDRDATQIANDPPKDIQRPRAPLVPGSPPVPYDTLVQEDAVLASPDFPTFRLALEHLHDGAHGYFAPGLDAHIAFRDPFVFLLHSNIDRLYARWQTDPAFTTRLAAPTLYGAEANLDVPTPDLLGNTQIQNLTHLVEPWSTGIQISENRPIRPWEPTHENQGSPHTYHHISVVAPPCYDTNLSSFRIDEVENKFNAATNRYQIVFNDVPEEETTWRAAVIRVYTCPDTTFRVKPGTEPPVGSPFRVAVGQATAAHGTHPHTYQDVRIWFQFTAGAVGTAPHDDGPLNTTIHCDETGEDFQFELLGHTIHRQTVAVEMVLDQTGSMAWPAGTSGLTRLSVLKDAANLFASLIQDNNGLGITRFDDVAYPPDDPTYGGMPITKITSAANRKTAHDAISAHGAHGNTSVGNGLIMGHGQLIALPNTGPNSYDNQAIVLLTDGIENRPLSIADAIGMGAVDNLVYAVGLGNEFQVNTQALNLVSGAMGGNLLLSGVLTPGTDDFFRVKKFFLQILANVTKTSIVRDPVGEINVGNRVTIPFVLCEADINCRVILLTDLPVVKLSVQTPEGQIIQPGNAAGFGVTFHTTGNTSTASFGLPVAFQAQTIQAGTWIAILEIDAARYKRLLSTEKDLQAAPELRTKGAKYCVSVHSFSNLRMNATVTQGAYEPGSTFMLRASLVEYNQPVEHRADVRAAVEHPDHTHSVQSLAEVQPGVFETTMVGALPGIYRFTVGAEGATYKGVPFTREEILTGALFREMPTPPPGNPAGGGISKGDLCDLLACLIGESSLTPEFEAVLKRHGVHLAGIRSCVQSFCKKAR